MSTTGADSAWNPQTGESVGAADLAELLAAAGATPAVPETPETLQADALRIDLIMTAPISNQSEVVDTFVTSDISVASDRMCSFLSRIVDSSFQVRIQIGALAAVICLHHDGHCFETAWMHRGLAHIAQEGPAMIVYLPEQLPLWVQCVCRAFQSMAWNGLKVQELEKLARQREIVQQHACNAAGHAATMVM